MLATANDYLYLSGWDFFKFFGKYRPSFIDIGKAVFKFLAGSGRNPLPHECERLFTVALLGSRVFAGLAQANNLPQDPVLQFSFAGPIARLLLDQEWQDIST
jgi:hypothetical protein